MIRVERILTELRARHGTSDRLTERLRPMIERIVDPSLSEDTQIGLLELVAETCDRDAQIERDSAAAIAAWNQYTQALLRLLRLDEKPPESPEAPESPGAPERSEAPDPPEPPAAPEPPEGV